MSDAFSGSVPFELESSATRHGAWLHGVDNYAEIVFEFSVPRMGRRIDVVLLVDDGRVRDRVQGRRAGVRF